MSNENENTNKVEEMKGRVKEAAGDLTDDEDLEDEGRIEQATSSVKDKVDDVANKVKDAITSDADQRQSS